MSGITLLGLGPGDPAKLTREAWEVLGSAGEIWLRTSQHPTVAGLPPSIKVHSFDDLYDASDSFEAVYAAIVEKILELGARAEGVVYAVPGDPFMAEATCPEIARRARAAGLPLKVVSGVSFLEPVFAALGLDPYPHLTLLDALEVSQSHIPAFPADTPALIAQVYSRMVAAEVKVTLNTTYPDEHPVRLVHAAGTAAELVEDLPLYEIDRSEHIGLLTVLYVPPLGEGSSFEAFQEIVAHLRAPEGCPWDREQTHQSLRSSLLEEAYEALAALDSDDPQKMAEEFGDLLLQIVLNAQISSEEGDFGMADVFKGIYDKLIRRHPHVFGETRVDGVGSVLKNWEKLKAEERAVSKEPEKGLLDGVPLALPALLQAQDYQDRAARVGFDWPELEGVLDKIAEEIQEFRQAAGQQELVDEMGDLIFSLVNLARWKKIDAESALRGTNMKFRQRFAYVEAGAKKQSRNLSDLSIEEMEALWQEAKSEGKD
ncbi:MAG TPA: nucleoside triphosphate pyrophosphohydrolase [Anaerolineales bacterium]|nr:nucleoside triphosphate pyrophosphohydrolase [Anaerolineales bacterium]